MREVIKNLKTEIWNQKTYLDADKQWLSFLKTRFQSKEMLKLIKNRKKAIERKKLIIVTYQDLIKHLKEKRIS